MEGVNFQSLVHDVRQGEVTQACFVFFRNYLSCFDVVLRQEVHSYSFSSELAAVLRFAAPNS